MPALKRRIYLTDPRATFPFWKTVFGNWLKAVLFAVFPQVEGGRVSGLFSSR